MFSAAESLVRRGVLHIDQIRWMGLQQGTFGLDGHLYSRKGIGMSLLLVPLVWLGQQIPSWGGATTALLFNSLVTAATAVLLFVVARQIGYGEREALIGALVFGLATLAWPYAKTCFSEPLAGLCLLIAFWALLRLRESASPAISAIGGAALALAVATRYANLAMIPLFGAFLVYETWRRNIMPGQNSLALWRVVGAFVLPLAIAAALLAAYNVARYGNPLDTGYLPEERFDGNWLEGVAGLLVSPGRGLFLYAPVLLLALPAIPTFVLRHRAIAVLAYSIALTHVLLYGKWFMWHGGYAWGPRFMVPTVPFLVIALLPVIVWMQGSARWRGFFVLLVVLSMLIQVLGLSVHFELFQTRLLDTGLPLFAPSTFFDPRYSPLIGQFEFLRPEHLDFVWATQGRVSWELLALLLTGSAIMGWLLLQAAQKASLRLPGAMSSAVSLVVLMALSGFVLTSAHQRWPEELRRAVEMLNQHASPADAIITATPEEATAFADLYRGRAEVLGLNAGALARDQYGLKGLERIVATHEHVWWLPNWLPPTRSDVERWLMEHGFRVEEHFFSRHAGSAEGRRLAHYFFPQRPLRQYALGDVLAGEVMLQRVATLDAVSVGAVLPVEVLWRALQTPEANYRVFVQLLDAAGERVAGADGEPALSQRPTSHWHVDEQVADRHALSLPPTLAAGDYQLVVGMYLPDSGHRLRTQDGADFVLITTVHVTTPLSR